MTDQIILARSLLATLFNNNQQAVLAFEKVIKYVNDNSQTSNSGVDDRLTAIENELISMQQSITDLSSLYGQVSDLQSIVNDLQSRIDKKRG